MADKDPYAPPQARIADAAVAPGSRLKAVSYGVLVDLGGTLVAGFLLGVVGIATGIPPEALGAAATSPDSWLFWTGGALGLGCSVLGGYVCARTARRDEMRLAAVVAAVVALAGYALDDGTQQLGTFLALTLLSIGAVFAGARWGAARNRSA
ncbi:MAG: hypothetical protein ACT4P3_09030 [Betaproteobacteria bacterium]